MRVGRGPVLAASIVAVVAGLLLGAAPAFADSYPSVPPPVTTLPSDATLPSSGSTLTAEEALLRKYQIQMGTDSWLTNMRMTLAGSSVNQVLTRMAPVARGGTVLTAGMAGAAIGAAGMRLYFAATGSDWDATMCSADQWVTSTYTVITLGVGSADCAAIRIPAPNVDQAKAYTVSGGGGTMTYTHQGSYGYPCWSYSMPAGYTGWYRANGSGAPVGAGWSVPTAGSSYCDSGERWSTVFPDMMAVTNSAGTVIATALPVANDPSRTYTCVISKVGGGTYTSAGVDVAESSGVAASGLSAACDNTFRASGLKPSQVTGVQLYQKTGTGTPVKIADLPIPPEVQTNEGLYPECYDTSTCQLTLEKVIGTTGDTVECFSDPGQCADWFTATSNATQTTTAKGDTYRCKYGTHILADLTECKVYQQAFNDPSASTRPGKVTAPDGSTLPGTSTGGATADNPGNTIDPSVDVGNNIQQCMGSWFSTMNPIDWVMTPVKCALRWAFVPRQSVVSDAQTGINNAYASSRLSSFVGSLGALGSMWPSGSGCSGLPLHLSGPGWSWDTTLLNACSEPVAGAAATIKAGGSFIIVILAVLAILRYAAAVFGFIGMSEATKNEAASSGVHFK